MNWFTREVSKFLFAQEHNKQFTGLSNAQCQVTNKNLVLSIVAGHTEGQGGQPLSKKF